MIQPIYVIWALLPLALAFFGSTALYRKVGRKRAREYPKDYFSQALFCAVALAIAIIIDQSVLVDMIISLAGDAVEPMFIRWTLYPLVLLIMAYLSSLFKVKKEPPKGIPGPRYAR